MKPIQSFYFKTNVMDHSFSWFTLIDRNDTVAIEAAISQKRDLEMRNPEGQTPLMYALYRKKLSLAHRFILAGADVNAQDQILNSPFLYAGASGFLDIVKDCLKHGANFKIYNHFGGTALIPAAERGHLEVVRLLANTPGFPINHLNHLGWTALLEAVVLSDGGPTHQEIIHTLVQSGADIHIKDKKGFTALDHAKQSEFREIVALLEAAAAK